MPEIQGKIIPSMSQVIADLHSHHTCVETLVKVTPVNPGMQEPLIQRRNVTSGSRSCLPFLIHAVLSPENTLLFLSSIKFLPTLQEPGHMSTAP